MDTEPEGSAEGPFEESLTPAVRRIDAEASDGAPTLDRPSEGPVADAATRGAGPDDDTEVPVSELIGPRRTLESSIQVVWVLQAVVPSLVIGGLAAVAFAFFPVGAPWMGGALALGLFLLAAALAVLRYRSWAYEVREDSLYLERGVVTTVQTVVPYVRIQHVDVSRGPVERAFGLATTVVYTAGSRGADVSIPGLTPERAEDLQARLKRLAIAAEGEDAV